MDEIFRGLVSVEVNDNDAVQKIASIVQGAKAQFAELSGLDVGQIGPDLTGPLGQNIAEVEQQIKKLRSLGKEAFANLGDAAGLEDVKRQLKEIDSGLNATLRKAREVQAATDPNYVAPAARPRGPGGRFISQAEADRLRAEAEAAQREAQEAQRRAENERSRAEADAIVAREQSRGDTHGKVTSEEDRIRQMEAAVDKMRANGVSDDDIAGYRKMVGLPEEEGATYRPRSQQDLDTFAKQGQPNLEAMEFEKLETKVQQAELAFDSAADGLDKNYKTVEQANRAEERYLGALYNLTVASENLAKARAKGNKMSLDAETADDLRAKALDDPRRELLGLGNREFLESQGYNLEEPSGRLKIQSELDKVKAATAKAIRDLENVVDPAEYNKLMEQRKALAVREIQLGTQLQNFNDKEARTARGDGGFRGGLLGRNKDNEGFGESLGFQAGITLKYFALYSAFAAMQGALEQIKEDTEAYTLAVNQLAIATGSTYDEARKLAEQYESQGAQFGQGPVATTQMMAKYARTYGTDSDTMEIAARVGAIVNTLEPKDHAPDVQQDLIGLANAYGIGPGGTEELLDKMFAVAKSYGYESPGEILPGVAAVGDIGKESGYDPAQLAALIASVMKQTGVGSDAAAGDIKRFLGSQNDPGLVQLFDRFGINQDETLREKLQELSGKIAGLDPEEQGRVLTSAGNPRIAAAVVAAIRGIPDSSKAEDAAAGSTGASAEAARKRLETFSGQLQQLGVQFEELFIELGKSGVADALGLLVKAGISVVDILGKFVKLLNAMPESLQQLLGILTVLLAVNKTGQMLSGGKTVAEMGPVARMRINGESVFGEGGFKGMLKGDAAEKAAQVQRSLAIAQGGTAVAATGAGTAATGLSARLGALGGALGRAAIGIGGLLASLLPAAALAGGAYIISDAMANKDQQEGAANEIKGGYDDLQKAREEKDPEKIKAAMERLKNGRKELDKGNDGFTNWLTNTVTPGLTESRDALGEKTDQIIADAQKEWDSLMQLEERLNSGSNTSKWFGKNYNNITRGVKLMKSRGLGAPEVTRVIEDVLAQNDVVVQSFLQPGEGQEGLEQSVSLAMERIGNTSDARAQTSQYGDLAGVLRRKRARMAATLAGQRRDLEEAQAQQARGVDVDPGEAEAAVANSETMLAALDGQLDQVNKAFTASLLNVTKRKIEILKKNYTGATTDAQIKAVLKDAMTQAAMAGDVEALTQLMDSADAAFNKQFADLMHQRQVALEMVRAHVEATMRKAEEALAGFNETSRPRDEFNADRAYRNARSNSNRVDAAEAAGKKVDDTVNAALAQSNPSGADTTGPADTLAIAKAMAGAVSGDPVSQAKASLAAAQVKLNRAPKDTAEYYDALRAVNDAKRALAEAENSAAEAEIAAGVEVGNPLAAAKAAVEAAARAVQFAIVGTADYWNKVKAHNEAKYNLARLEMQRSIAEAAAAVIPGDPMSAAVANIKALQVQIARTKDPTEYWTLMKQLREAQYEKAKIELQMASARDTLNIDITDPVALANARVREATRQLEFDRRRGAGASVILQDQVALRQAQSDAQATTWNTEFARQRTNYELQRTSLSAYLSYLRAQHDYLTAVKNKTYEQVQELNQVDQALKGLTDSLQGQWNLGDIKVPTAYEMRRAVTGAGGQAGTTVYIDFKAGTAEDFRGVLETYVGTSVMQTVGTATTKV